MVNTTKKRKVYWVGIRVEVPNKFMITGLPRVYKSKFKCSDVSDVIKNSKIIEEPFAETMIVSKCSIDEKSYNTSFAVLMNFGCCAKKAKRLLEMVNIIGDNKLLKETVKNFVAKKSVLNLFPEFECLVQIFKNIDLIMPGFINVGKFSAPEVKCK